MFDFIGFLGCNAPSFFMLFHSLLIDSFEGSRIVIFLSRHHSYNSRHHIDHMQTVCFLCVSLQD